MTDPNENGGPLSDAERRELADFTEEFRRSRPDLPDDAIGRIAERLRTADLKRRARKVRWRLAIAASLFLATIAVASYFGRAKPPQELPHQIVFDTVTLPYHPAPAPAPAGALLPLNDYRTLFTD